VIISGGTARDEHTEVGIVDKTQESLREQTPWDQARHNAKALGEHDIVVAGDPGGGAALISNIVHELGYDYLDPYIPVPDPGGTAQSGLAYYRQRLAATAGDGRGTPEAGEAYRRFIKTHFYPDVFTSVPLNAAVLLVRDPRDTMYSSYKWFSSFGGSWIPDAAQAIGKLTYAEFLDRVRIGDGEKSIPGWVRFHRGWLEAAPTFSRFAVVRFEDLKSHPVGAITALLAALGLVMPPDVVARAAERSSFDAMRAREAEISATEGESTKNARIMRRGKVGEWREWMGTDGMAERFAHPDLIATAAQFGYDLTSAR
jgi:hypothetical protein